MGLPRCCLKLHVASYEGPYCILGVSYFVYNEKIDIYSGKQPDQMEFMEAALAYIGSLLEISTSVPVYRLYQNKAYRDYEKILRRVQKAGTDN